MKVFADNLRNRAKTLALSNAEVARRAHIAERTYANYVLDRTEPSLDALVRISRVLMCTTDDLLIVETHPATASPREQLLVRLQAGSDGLADSDLEALVAQVEAIVAVRRRAGARHKANAADDS